MISSASQPKKRGGTQTGSKESSQTQKKPRHEKSDTSIFSGNSLHQTPDAQLLQRLVKCSRALRDAQPSFKVSADFVKEILSPRYLKSSLAGVQQMTGCLLSEITRRQINSDATNVGGPLLLDAKYADDVLDCLVAPFKEAVSCRKSLKTCEHIMDYASTSRIFFHLIPRCVKPLEERLTELFASVSCASGRPRSAGHVPENSRALTSASTAEMAKILQDVLRATGSITGGQLAPLLEEIAAASPALQRRIEACRARGSKHDATAAATDNSPGKTAGAVIAGRVLLEHLSVIQPAVSSYISDMVKNGVAAASSTDTSEEAVRARDRGRREVGRGMEFLVALVELHVDLVSHVLPTLESYFSYADDTVRMIIMQGVFTAFGAHESAVSRYRNVFHAFLTCFNDPKEPLSVEMLQLCGAIVHSRAAKSGKDDEVGIIDEVLPYVEQRLVDNRVTVRLSAVAVYSDLVTAVPSLVSSERMQKTLGLRVADKNLRVRQIAVEQLCQIYQREGYSWIPDTVLSCVNAEGGVMLLETQFETMLPPPRKDDNAERIQLGGSGSPPSASHRGQKSTRQNIRVFDFEGPELENRTYASSLAMLCGNLSPANFNLLLTLAGKKAQLRCAILRLFELRGETRNMDLSAGDRTVVENVRRLLKLLKDKTHAENNEWETLFRSKDDRVSKAFISCCSVEVIRYATERRNLVKALEGHVDAPVLKFVRDQLSKQMMFGIEIEHVEELLMKVNTTCRAACDGEQVPGNSPIGNEVKGVLRALLLCGRAASVFLTICADTLISVLLKLGAKRNTDVTLSWMVVILSFICEWSNYMCERREMLDGSARCRNDDDPAVARCKEGVVKMLSTLCVRRSVDLSTNAGIGVMGKVYKGAVRCLIALMRMPELQDLNVLRELVKKLCEHVNKAKSEASCNLVCWLKALTALAKDRTTARMESTLLMKSVTAILITAQSNAEVADEAHMKTKASELPSMTTASAVVDAAAKCLTAIAMSSPSEDMGNATDATLNTLLNTCDQIEKSDQHTVGACLRRCSIKQQLLRLVIRPPPNIGSEVAVAVALSTETETVVRRVIQSKMTFNILNRKCDVRYVAYLILTAVAEDSKSGYRHLRNLFYQTGTYLRTKQEAPGVTLSSPTAWNCFIEYSIPFLVLFMAHHPYYDVEKTHFTSFQRVWHLLFDELFRYSVQCASFVTEMLNRIKQTDDPLNSESNAMRTMCDLGIRVMQECMGQRQISTDALRRYPGAVSLPSFFVGSSSTQEALDKVYLDPSVLISAKVPFRPPVTPGGGITPGGAPSAPNVAGGEEDEEDAMESDE